MQTDNKSISGRIEIFLKKLDIKRRKFSFMEREITIHMSKKYSF